MEILNEIRKEDDFIDSISKLSIIKLETLINYASDIYHSLKEPILSDAEYDILIDFLLLKNPKSKILKKIGTNDKTKNKVKLDYWLGSMDKIKPPSNQLDNWIKKYPPPYNLSDKLDGVSGLLIYNNNELSLFTRGSSIEGQNISGLLKYIVLPTYKKVNDYCNKHNIQGVKNMIAFRGEIIMKDNIFNKKWSDKMKNPRNTISGLVNSKNINPELAQDVDLVLYEIVDPFYPIDKQLDIISQLGFNTVVNNNINSILSFEVLSNYLKERKKKSVYDVDGIIVTSLRNSERNIKGNPEYAFAFKDVLEEQISKTKVIDVEWNASKHGYLIPTLILEPVNIGGVEIKRVTAHNAKFIVDNFINIGTEIELIRSGDVIPKVLSVLKKSKKPNLPDGKWHWNETEVDIILDNKNTDDVLVKNIYFFFSKLETKGLGEKVIEKMVNAKLDSIYKILSVNKDNLLQVEGIKEKSAENILEAIKSATNNVPLYKLMAASNKLGEGMGEERMKQVLSVYPNLLNDYKKWSKTEFIDNIKEISGWEDKTASLLVSNFNKFIIFYKEIESLINIELPSKKVKGNKLDNKIIVLTGFRDKNLQNLIESEGGKVGSSVSKNTDYVIVKDKSVLDNPTDKIVTAEKLGIKVLIKLEFEKLFYK